MKTWYKVHDSRTERPSEVDTTSSATTVYERRNIQQETIKDEMSGESVTQWVYEQREYTREEWAAMHSPAMQTVMQAIRLAEGGAGRTGKNPQRYDPRLYKQP